MRYVARDETGAIIAVFAEPNEGYAEEPISTGDPELVAFMGDIDSDEALRTYLAASDSDLLRIMEDLINVLIGNNLILLTDFPEAVQSKLMRRQTVRAKLQNF